MTAAHEVHLFAWMKENFIILGACLTVIWAMLVYWFKIITARYITRQESSDQTDNKIAACKIMVDKRDDSLERAQFSIVDSINSLSRKIDHLDDRRREDANNNNAAHEHIMSMIVKKNGGQ